MKGYYFSVIFLSILQPQISGFLLVTIPVALASSKKESDESVFILAFLAGLLVDLFAGTSLGITSIFLLFEAVLVQRLAAQFRNSLRMTLFVAGLLGIIFQVIFRNWFRL
jgi:cell shape-determining protein MreD